jgi:hypothetical protein
MSFYILFFCQYWACRYDVVYCLINYYYYYYYYRNTLPRWEPGFGTTWLSFRLWWRKCSDISSNHTNRETGSPFFLARKTKSRPGSRQPWNRQIMLIFQDLGWSVACCHETSRLLATNGVSSLAKTKNKKCIVCGGPYSSDFSFKVSAVKSSWTRKEGSWSSLFRIVQHMRWWGVFSVPYNLVYVS